jgi:hypothetical protein
MIIVFRLVAITTLAAAIAVGQDQGGRSLFGGRSLLHAHNAYPEKGRWHDRIDRALGTGSRPVVIEQDVALARRGGEAISVVTHDTELTGQVRQLSASTYTVWPSSCRPRRSKPSPIRSISCLRL